LKKNNILLIIQRSNGDVYLAKKTIDVLKEYFNAEIDLLINEDTLATAKLFKNIRSFICFSYEKKKKERFSQELKILKTIYKKYDLSINLTASDRSTFYCILAGKKTVSAVEFNKKKSWWKRMLLSDFYEHNFTEHIFLQNLKPLDKLKIPHDLSLNPPKPSESSLNEIKKRLNEFGITNFIIFHPSAQYDYKIYPKNLRDRLLRKLTKLDIPIVITGGNSEIDQRIRTEVPESENIYNFIGDLTLSEYMALSDLSTCYIGMDTLNMHIAASQNKRVFAIFGPTLVSIWSPWSNILKTGTKENIHIQTYGSNTIFQANLECVACGKAGCNDQHDVSLCLDHIDPELIYKEVKSFINDQKI